MLFKSLLFVFLLSITGIYAQSPIVKMDFDQAGRNESEVNQVGYTPWVIAGAVSSSKTENGVTFTVTKVGSFGDQLSSSWFKTGIQASTEGKLVNDGITVKDGTADQGGQIEFRISGLEAGNHTLLVFLNQTSSDTFTYSPIDVSLNGNLIEDNIIPTVRAANSADSQSVYINIEAIASTDVVILFSAETSGSEDVKNVLINGFELNTPNIFEQATEPIPAHNNEHVELSSTNVLLKWTPAASALSQNIYFGTDETSVANADTSSSEYKGNQDNTSNSYQVNGLYTGETYYWRVDQIASGGNVTKGNLWRFRPAQLAFPEAEGYGRFARGGRGGKVVVVTNLNDSGPGSFREAVTNNIGPRTIVFNVSGIIQLSSRLVSSQPYVTIAGQTAPGKGITIRSAPLGITGDDNIMQNIRVRLGSGQTFDGMGLTGGEYSIIDHCSISWTIDEAFSSRGAHNITLQRTLISEALNAAGHQNYPVGTEHGYAASIGGDIGSFHHNLLAHNYGRNWSLAGGLDGSGFFAGKLDITNNVVYNWGSRTTDGGANEVNFVGNYYKPGPGMQLERYAFTLDHEDDFGGMQRCYFNGNVMPGYFDENNQEFGRRSRISNGITINYETFVNTPFFPSYVTTQTAGHAYKMVLSDVGCTQPVFDDHDQRMINETLTGTYSVTGSVTGKKGFPDNEADSGGYENYPFITRPADWDSDNDGLPNWYESTIGTNINSPAGDFSDSNADVDMDGYTNLDDYLQWMALPHFSTETGAKIDVNIQQLSRGFTSGVSYVVSDVVNGTANLVGDIVEFTPTATGLASFDFTVTDSAGDSMTRTVNILNGFDLTLSVEKQNLNEIKV
ncbi:T9SS C-terminal target domain-containing protein [Thalassobellus suaedae]|uniref:T9SS C-terminal target domain-containing protein n=1 Tax=Thalassobellus suaedae TaxID=3074124 RepID=A0ABY9XTC5_9FLAO|nr:T9SS C-terminal target domain-containing protein [Flavobacteriaceae bacterium HL-DH14]